MLKQLYFFRSLKGMIIIFFSFYFIIFMTVFGFVGYRIFSSIFMNNVLGYTQQIVNEARRNIDSYLSQVDLILTSTAASHSVIRHVELYETDKEKCLRNRWRVEDYLQNSIKFNPKIRDIMLISSGGKILSTSGKGVIFEYNFKDQKWFPVFNDTLRTKYTIMHPQNYYYENFGGELETVSAVVPVSKRYSLINRNKAVVMCNLNLFDLFETFQQIKLEKNSTFILLDKENNIIVNTGSKKYDNIDSKRLSSFISQNESPFYTDEKNRRTAVIYTESKMTGWLIISLIPEEELLKHIKLIKYIFIFFAMFILLIMIASYNFLNRIITQPIRYITMMMNKIEQGDFSVKINETTTRDTEYLSNKINSLVKNIVNLNTKIFSIEIKNKEAQIKALQSQINPHFLFNTLQSIKAASVSSDKKQTSRMITHLGNMLRYGIYNQEELVTISDEIAHLQDYLKIQSYRFPDLFTYSIECPEELQIKKTIKLLLQPHVENAITHNKDKTSAIEILIKFSKQEKNILIEVSDTGEGINKEKLKSLKQYIQDINLEDKSESIGIKNVHNRIFLRFGSPYGISIESEYKNGFTVNMLIPDID